MSENRETRPGRTLYYGTGAMLAGLALVVFASPDRSSPTGDRSLAPADEVLTDLAETWPDGAVATPRLPGIAAPLATLDLPRLTLAVAPAGPAVTREVAVRATLPLPERPPRPEGDALTSDAFERATRLDVYEGSEFDDARSPLSFTPPKRRFQLMTDVIRRTRQQVEDGTRVRRRHGVSRQRTLLVPTVHPLLAWLKSRSDIDGLTMLEGDDCVQSRDEATRLALVSNGIARVAASQASQRQPAPTASTGVGNGLVAFAVTAASLRATEKRNAKLDEQLLAAVDATEQTAPEPLDASGAHQVLQVGSRPVRERLVRLLAEQPGDEATKALVQRALFDHVSDVREQAVAALADRPAETYRDQLLAGLEHPWPAAADHAADALIALEATDLVDELLAIADRPDPRAPAEGADGLVRSRELVRVNHQRNCLMCHAPVVQPVMYQVASGTVPDPYAPPPPVYYGSSPQQRGRDVPVVRADITYLWQDFSIVHTLDPSQVQTGWPTTQRFDYLVRNRVVEGAELDELRERYAARSPQRAAARFAAESLDVVLKRRLALVAAR